jgi:hypothetical protein
MRCQKGQATMNTKIVLNSQRMYPANIWAPVAEHREAPTASDVLAMERLEDRFAELTWKAVAPITALSLTFAVGILACAQFFVLHS